MDVQTKFVKLTNHLLSMRPVYRVHCSTVTVPTIVFIDNVNLTLYYNDALKDHVFCFKI